MARQIEPVYGKRQQLETIMVDAVAARRTGTTVTDAVKVIHTLGKDVGRDGLRQVGQCRRQVVNRPVAPNAGRRVGIVAKQGETARIGGRAAPTQRGRDIGAVTGETARYVLAVVEDFEINCTADLLALKPLSYEIRRDEVCRRGEPCLLAVPFPPLPRRSARHRRWPDGRNRLRPPSCDERTLRVRQGFR